MFILGIADVVGCSQFLREGKVNNVKTVEIGSVSWETGMFRQPPSKNATIPEEISPSPGYSMENRKARPSHKSDSVFIGEQPT